MPLEINSSILSVIAERKIQEAMKEGQFDNLPGRGRPQVLEDLSGWPDDSRLAYIILKNSGYAPEGLKDATSLKALVSGSPDTTEALKRLNRLKAKLKSSSSLNTLDKLSDSPYFEKILSKV
ncbi:MAG: DUF1992 domain-containing protein [Deltaproteobacteria bacterium]|jgi:hypothetical protein|nr:DUF1992 domain-containing protein [Deltaproteobacteria bacterium]